MSGLFQLLPTTSQPFTHILDLLLDVCVIKATFKLCYPDRAHVQVLT